MVALVKGRSSPVVVGVSIVRIEADGLVIAPDGLVVFPLMAVGEAPVVVGKSKVLDCEFAPIDAASVLVDSEIVVAHLLCARTFVAVIEVLGPRARYSITQIAGITAQTITPNATPFTKQRGPAEGSSSSYRSKIFIRRLSAAESACLSIRCTSSPIGRS